MCSNSEIRRMAREQLQGHIFSGNWLTMLAVCFVVSAALGVASSIIPFASLFLTGAALIGLAAVTLTLVRNPFMKIQWKNLLYGFETDHFLKSFVLYLLQGLLIFLWSLLFIIPGYVKAYAYSMAYYISLDRPELSAQECLEESERLMDGHKWDLFLLDLSFIGWHLLCLFTFGIGYLFLQPYVEMAKANFYDQLVQTSAE